MKLTGLSDEELKEVSMQKNRKGCATSDALRAQRLLRERYLMDWGDGTRPEAVPYGTNETEW